MEMGNKIKYYLIGATCIIASGYFFYVVFTQYNLPLEPPLPGFVPTNFLLADYSEEQSASFFEKTHLDCYIQEEEGPLQLGFISRERPLTIYFGFTSLNFDSKWRGYTQVVTIRITEPRQQYTLYDRESQIIGDPSYFLYKGYNRSDVIIAHYRPYVVFDYDTTHLDTHEEIDIYVHLLIGGEVSYCTLKLETVSEDEYNALDAHRSWEQVKRFLESDDEVRVKNENILYGGISLVIGLIVILVVKNWEKQ